MNAPQVVMIVMLSINFAVNLIKHGEPEKGKHNVFTSLFSIAITVGLLYWGGFWGK